MIAICVFAHPYTLELFIHHVSELKICIAGSEIADCESCIVCARAAVRATGPICCDPDPYATTSSFRTPPSHLAIRITNPACTHPLPSIATQLVHIGIQLHPSCPPHHMHNTHPPRTQPVCVLATACLPIHSYPATQPGSVLITCARHVRGYVHVVTHRMYHFA